MRDTLRITFARMRRKVRGRLAVALCTALIAGNTVTAAYAEPIVGSPAEETTSRKLYRE